MSKILKLQTANVKCLSVVEITPEGAVVTIGGANGAGKSSVLDSIEYACRGGRSIPAEPLRKGQRKGRTIVTLDDGTKIQRTYTPKGSTLVVTGADGEQIRSPQALLDRLVGALAFDPLQYSREDPAKQAAILRELAGVDTSEIERKRAAVYERRTDVNREVKRLDARLDAMPEQAAAEPVSVSDLVDKLAAADVEQRANDLARGAADDAKRSAEALRAEAASLAEAEALAREAEAERAKRADAALAAVRAEVEKQVAIAAELAASAAKITDPDVAALRSQLAGAEQQNERARANAARAKVAADLAEAEHEADSLTSAIERLDEAKAEALAAAAFPVPGLGFDARGVTLDGVPFEQASQAERLRVSVAMGLALNPELRVLLVRDGSLLDAASLAMVADMAEKADAQVWLEVVSDTGEGCQVVIEDGHVREDVPIE